MRNVALIGTDELAYTSENHISRVVSNLKRKVHSIDSDWRLSRNERVRDQCLKIETEICYMQREIMWRKKREACHREYLKNRRQRS